MKYVDYSKYSVFLNPFIYNLSKIMEENNKSENFFFRYEGQLYDTINNNPDFKDTYFHHLLGNDFTSRQLYMYTTILSHTVSSPYDKNTTKKYTIKDILNDHWDSYVPYMSKKCNIPDYVNEAVDKVRICHTNALGFDSYTCPECGNVSIRFHTCKSRFCSSCGTKYAKERAINIQKKVFKCKHRHIVLTIPNELRHFFKKDKELLNELFNGTNDVVNYLFNGLRENKRVDKCKAYTITPGYVCVLHTFGRDLKWNPHIHMLISEGGHDSRTNLFTKVSHFNYTLLRKSWQKVILDLLTKKLDKSFYKLKSKLYRTKDNGFYVYAPKQQFTDTKKGIDYVVRYTGRPVMSESRITNYDGENVTWWYHPHEDEDKTIVVKDKAFDFISKLIQHISQKHFKTVRYYGAYSAKNHKYRDCNKKEYNEKEINLKQKLLKHRNSIIFNYNKDPLECKICGNIMKIDYSKYVIRKDGKIIDEYTKQWKKEKIPRSWQDRTNYCPTFH